MPEVLVIGAGIVGLSTAVLLAKAGHRVTIWTKERCPNTTSNKAGAFWFPAYGGDNEDPHRLVRWCIQTYDYVKTHLADKLDAGVMKLPAYLIYDEARTEPIWKAAVSGFRRAHPEEIPSGYNDGFCFETYTMDPLYLLPYLEREFESLEGRIVSRTVERLSEALEAPFDVVVNCAGLGAGHLALDQDLHAARGQIVQVRHNGFGRVISADSKEGCAYIIPRKSNIVLGGTFQRHNESMRVSESDTAKILDRVRAISSGPWFDSVEIVAESVGLRPCRSAVRLEVDLGVKDKLLIHNYGHGGSGFTLNWGCAMEVCDLVAANLIRN